MENGTPIWVQSAGQALVLADIVTERAFQDRKWGAQRHIDPYKWNTILGEEFGEVCEATLDLDRAIRGDTPEQAANQYKALRKEIVQVAAVAAAMLEDFDFQFSTTKTIRFAT